jgi:hypothetical protein
MYAHFGSMKLGDDRAASGLDDNVNKAAVEAVDEEK